MLPDVIPPASLVVLTVAVAAWIATIPGVRAACADSSSGRA
jgi:hypothetical protein